jgi:amyloid beta precursor protein binding protein 1
MIALQRWREKKGESSKEEFANGGSTADGGGKRFRSGETISRTLSYPKTTAEKDDLKAILEAMRRSPQEANFDEAQGLVYQAWTPYRIPDGMQNAMDTIPESFSANVKHSESSTSMSSQGYVNCPGNTSNGKGAASSDFWRLVAATKEFASQNGGMLPLMGSLPDFVSDTESYIALQQAYNAKAKEDRQALAQLAGSGAGNEIDPEFLKRFCQFCMTVDVFRYKSFREELSQPNEDTYQCECGDEDAQMGVYLAMSCAAQFASTNGRWPGQSDDANLSSDLTDMVTLQKEKYQAMSEYVAQVDRSKDYLKEIVRYGGSELHPTAAFLGGVTSQEVVKIITKQFTPLNNTFVYNGVFGKAQTLEF